MEEERTMPSLQIRDLPEEVYQKLLRLAKQDHRSLSQEAAVVLARCIGREHDPRDRRQAVLRRVLARSEALADVKLPDPAELIREDRDR
jgi:plasmid stability protein